MMLSISYKFYCLAWIYLLLLICYRVRWALKGILGKGGSQDLQDQRVYQPSTCGRIQQRNGLPFR